MRHTELNLQEDTRILLSIFFLSHQNIDIINCILLISDTWQSIVAGHIALVTAKPTGDEICAVSGCVLQIRCLVLQKEVNSVNNNNTTIIVYV